MDRGLASMSSCPECGSPLLEGTSFCSQCGTPVSEGEPTSPQFEADATRPPLELARAEEMPRFTPHAAGEPTCRFCKGALDLSGEFCEQCGAPVAEAASSGWLKPAAAGHPVVSKQSSPPVPSAAHPTGPPAAKVIASPAPLSYAAAPSVPPPPEAKASRARPLNIVTSSPAPDITGPPAAKVTSSPAPPPYAASPPVPPRPEEKASKTRPLNIVTSPQANQLGARAGKSATPPMTLRASPPSFAAPPRAPTPITSAQVFAPKALAAEPPKVTVGLLPNTVAAPLHPTATPREIAEPLPGPTPIVPVPLSVFVREEAVSPAQPKRPFPLVIAGGIAGLLLAISMAAGWYLLHRKAQSARVGNVTAQQVRSPAPTAEIAAPTPESVDTSSPLSELPEESPLAPAPARKPRRVKAAPAATPVAATPALDPKTAVLASVQNLAREAYAKGNYAEPRDTSAIAYSKQALALDPANDYSRTLLESSIKGGKYQVQQAISSKDFTTAHRIADLLAQLLPGESAVADLKAELASAEKADEESRRARQVPAAVLSFRVYHMHSGKAPGDNGPYCRGTLSVVAGRLKYVGETAPDGQVHSFDFACSEVLEVKKNFRVASRENGFHVRTASSNINFVPEDASVSHISALASACSR